jgi:hypothetical protein
LIQLQTKHLHDRLSPFGPFGLVCASAQEKRERLPSGVAALDHYLEGGIPSGSICEWGLPMGKSGREIILRWLIQLSQNGSMCLWVSSKEDLLIYPPAWSARGVLLKNIRFADTQWPVRQLKPAFMESVFKLIVLDSPGHFTEDDCAFVAHQARANGYTILVLRDWLLGQRKGNVWARLRLNCWREGDHIRIETIKGLSARGCLLTHSISNSDNISVH